MSKEIKNWKERFDESFLPKIKAIYPKADQEKADLAQELIRHFWESTWSGAIKQFISSLLAEKEAKLIEGLEKLVKFKSEDLVKKDGKLELISYLGIKLEDAQTLIKVS